jgi:hypothetical protein
MSDIVERLRHCSENCGDEYLHELTGKAADTITRLTAENERLTIEVEAAKKFGNGFYGEKVTEGVRELYRGFARAALSGDKHE